MLGGGNVYPIIGTRRLPVINYGTVVRRTPATESSVCYETYEVYGQCKLVSYDRRSFAGVYRFYGRALFRFGFVGSVHTRHYR